MKGYRVLVFALMLAVSLPACDRQTETIAPTGQAPASFSFQEDAAIYRGGDPGVDPNEFVNTDICPIETQDAAVGRAKKECTIEYDAASGAYDDTADMWRIDFYTAAPSENGTRAVAGNCQSVYLNSDGVTQLIVYGE